jgi:hypothetical protein
MAYIGKQPVIGNFVKLDAISVVNGQASYTMQNGGANFTAYANVNQFLVSLNGILQSPTDSFTVSSSTITFASNLQTGDVIDFIIVLGNTLDVGVPSDNTVSLAKLTATGTKDATTFLRGDNTFAEAGGGIEEVDMFRMTTDFTTNDATLSNFERVDDATFSKIGTGMTESSGIFTFPSTGLWHVIANPMITVYSDAELYVQLQVSTDSGSNYDDIATVNAGLDTSQRIYASVYQSSFVNVTNASTFRIRLRTEGLASLGRIEGNTASNYTTIKFIKLGDSQ